MNQAPHSFQVAAGVATYVHLQARLKAELPDLDDITLADTLEGITDLRELLAQLIRSALEDEVLASALTTRLAELRSRLQRLGQRADKKRALALKAMAEADIKKLVAPDFTASLRLGAPVLDIVAEDRIPSAYWKPQPPKLDRLGLLAALRGGTEVEGAMLAAPEFQLNVRTK